MNAMKPKVFIDTNVLLDYLLSRQPGANAATELLVAAQMGVVEALVSTQSILDAAYTARKSGLDFQTFKHVVSILKGALTFAAIDWIDLDWAMEHYTGDFEDDAQYASAYNSCCDYYITRDKKLLGKNSENSPLCVITAEDFVAQMK